MIPYLSTLEAMQKRFAISPLDPKPTYEEFPVTGAPNMACLSTFTHVLPDGWTFGSAYEPGNTVATQMARRYHLDTLRDQEKIDQELSK